MADWATISSLATAGGTLVLAAATFASVRSANRAARAAERSLMAGLRPLLVPSRLDDPVQKVGFADRHWLRVDGGYCAAELADDTIYLAISLRNAGNGIAVLDRWYVHDEPIYDGREHTDIDEFRRLTRDIYVPAGDLGFWQGAFRDRADPGFAALERAIRADEPIMIDLEYGDYEGGQRTISRFTLTPVSDGRRLATVGRHWNLDRADPR